ncbi:hypothetical protein NC653_004870 [Populus alba x Populus x berolinensis]|uniref:Uncharacterized protein n=1 Tax=Populus alba x Populus x berolinensis TaxID=444605 RepID=A0AAD6RWA1_9ROSI|nr:hypothetical protein NC653_004870 [Populus alba x Populus x berolinensis]
MERSLSFKITQDVGCCDVEMFQGTSCVMDRPVYYWLFYIQTKWGDCWLQIPNHGEKVLAARTERISIYGTAMSTWINYLAVSWQLNVTQVGDSWAEELARRLGKEKVLMCLGPAALKEIEDATTFSGV